MLCVILPFLPRSAFLSHFHHSLSFLSIHFHDRTPATSSLPFRHSFPPFHFLPAISQVNSLSIKAIHALKLVSVCWASERDYSSLGFKLYARPGPFASFTTSGTGWSLLVDTPLSSVTKFTGNRAQLNRTVLPIPIVLAPGEEASFYLFAR